MKIRGFVTARLFDKDGVLLSTHEGENLVVTVGRGMLTGLITGLSALTATYMALGTGSTAVVAADTTLETEITTAGGQRKVATVTQQTTTVTNDTARWVATYAVTGSFTVTAAGLVNTDPAGSRFARKLFGAGIPVVNGNVLEVTWNVVFS